MVIKNFKDYLDSINEGLIKTNDPNIVLKNTLNTLHLLNVNINGTCTNNTIDLELPNFYNIPINKVEEIFDVIMVYMVNIGGWFPSNMTITSIHKLIKKLKYNFEDIMKNHDVYENIIITFESKFGEIEPNIPDKLYHLTIREYEKKILKNGLIPKSKSKLTSHTDRIFICKTITDCELLKLQMIMHYNSEKDNNIYTNGNKKYKKDTNMLILEIDNNDNIIKKLYKDPNYVERGYYTVDNIPPKYIKVVKYL